MENDCILKIERSAMQHVFIIGSRGLPAKYGGFETFVEELVTHKQSADVY